MVEREGSPHKVCQAKLEELQKKTKFTESVIRRQQIQCLMISQREIKTIESLKVLIQSASSM